MTTITDHDRDFVREHGLCVLATGRADGSPQLSTVVYDYDGDHIVLSAKTYTAKWKNVLRQPRVSLAVLDGRSQVIVYGTAEPVADDPERTALSRRVGAKMGMPVDDITDDDLAAFLDAEERTIIRVTPTKMLYTP